MFSYLTQKRTSLFCCIFACLITINYSQDSFASSSPDKNQTSIDSSINKEKKNNGIFSRIIGTVFRKKITRENIKETDLAKLNTKLFQIEKRIARVSRQQYNTKHVQRNKLSIAFKSRQLGKILKRLTNQKVVVVKHISLIKKEQNLVTESAPDASPLNTKTYNINQEDQKPVLAEVSQVQSVKKDIVTKRVSGIKTETLNVSLKTEVQSKNKITKASIKHTVNKPEIERPEKKKNALYSMLPYNDTEVHDKSLSNLQLTIVNDKTMLPKTNKAWTFEEKTDVPDLAVKINNEPAKSEPQDLMTLKLANKTVEPIVVLQEEKIAEPSLVINKNYGTAMDITSISGTIEEQIMEMVVNGNTDEIKMALEDGNSIGVLRVLLVNNISREDLTLTEKDTINDYITILGKIGNKEDIKILSDIKVTNRNLTIIIPTIYTQQYGN